MAGSAEDLGPADDTFATWLRRAREDAGWGKLAAVEALEEVGIKARAYYRWESGEISKPDPRQVRIACLRLGIDPREAAIALGIVTREELGLPPAPPPIDASLREASRILASDDVPNDAKEQLRTLIGHAVGFIVQGLGLRMPRKVTPPAEPSAADRAKGKSVR